MGVCVEAVSPVPRDGPDRVALVDEERVHAVLDQGLLDAPAEPALDRLTELAAGMLDVPTCTLSLVLPDRQVFVSRYDEDEPGVRETPIRYSYCRHVVDSGEPLVVPDAREHPLLEENPAIPEYGAIAYLGYPLRDAGGHVLGTVCAIDTEPHPWGEQDLRMLRAFTGMVSAELQMRDARRRSQREPNAVATAAVAHELRTPLTSIFGFASTLQVHWNEIPDEQRLEFIGIIQEQARRLARLVDDLLTQSHLHSGMMRARPEEVPLVQAATAVVDGFPDLSVRVVGDRDLRARVDRMHLDQLLVNLVGNAAKYGGGEVSIEVARPEGDPEVARIAVVDHGAGVRPDGREELFVRHGQDEERRHAKGSGLGLWIVRELTQLNGGSCRYEETPGGGATFVLELPAANGTGAT